MGDIEKLLAEATRGPWRYHGGLRGHPHAVVPPDGDAEMGTWFVAATQWEPDARLIALTPQLATALIEARKAIVSLIAAADFSPHRPIGHVASDASAALARIDAIMGERDD